MFVHSSRIRKQFDYLKTLGISSDEISSVTGISYEEALDTQRNYSLDQFIDLLEYALEASNDPYYGLNFGADPHIAGTIGMLCASCKNLKEAFIQGCKYFRVQGDFMDLQFIDDPVFPRIRYKLANAWLLKSPHTAQVEVEAMFSFLVCILKANSNQSLLPYQIKLSWERPSDTMEYKQKLGVVPQFEKDENEIFFRGRDLLIPMKAFNPETFELLRSHVESSLEKSRFERSISEKVRTILLSSLRYRFPDMDTVASKLNMSARTLQRQLSNEKTSYKSLLQDTRSGLAKQLLKQNELSISEISFMLGYSDLGNFSRSFKKINGCSPQEYRQAY